MKFSIIIPCYKVEKYIDECLESVLSQDCQDWEAICVDDGSPDKTGAILDGYAARDQRIVVIHQPNGGLSAARNSALKVAKGDWIYYLDSDDLMGPGALTAVCRSLGIYPQADMVWGQMVSFNDGDSCPWPENEDSCVVDDVGKIARSKYFMSYFQRYFYKRSVFGGIPFVGESWCEERPYFAKCIATARYIVELNHVVFGFRDRDGSITHVKMTQSQCIGYLDATRDMLRTLAKSGKTIEPSLMRFQMTKWMEVSPRYLVDHISSRERKAVWRHWFASLKEAQAYRPLTLWRRFTIVICRILPFRIIALAVCYLPDWLKRKGLHR